MKKNTEYRFANYGNIAITILTEQTEGNQKTAYKLLQNGILLVSGTGDGKTCTLVGNAGVKIEVNIKKTFFGMRYDLLVNNMKIVLTKVPEEVAVKRLELITNNRLREAEQFDKKSQKFYPIFKPGDWSGMKMAANTIFLGDESNPLLLIGYGYSLENSFTFLTILDLKKQSIESIHSEAVKNIEEYPVNIEISKAIDQPILMASGSDFSSEKILSNTFLEMAQEKLNTKEMLVSIPRRTCIMMMSKNADADNITKFVELHYHAWNDNSYGNAPIFNGLFIVKNGKIESVKPLG